MTAKNRRQLIWLSAVFSFGFVCQDRFSRWSTSVMVSGTVFMFRKGIVRWPEPAYHPKDMEVETWA